MLRSKLAVASLALLALGTACRRQRPVAAPPAPAPEAPAPTPAPVDDSAERARREAEAREAARRAEEARIRAALEATVYFAYDRSDLDAEARSTLEAKLPLLQTSAAIRLRISGHTDDRGSDEYNLALGQRRAAAVKRFLSQHGIDEGRFELASFGEEQPTCTTEEESCWSQNRRATFEIISGTIATASPR